MTTPRHPQSGRFTVAPQTIELPDGRSLDTASGTVSLPGGGAHVDHRLSDGYVGPGERDAQPCQYLPLPNDPVTSGVSTPDAIPSWNYPAS